MKRRIGIWAALVLAALAGGRAVTSAAERAPAAAHAHGAGKESQAERAAVTELGAQAAFDRDGVLWAVHKVSGHIAVSRSVDGGATWANPVLVTAAPEPTDGGRDARPKIALGTAGEIYLTWTRPMTKPYTGEIRFARSVDGGRTFSASAVVHRDRQEITHRFDALAVNAKGQVFVAWIDKRDLVAAAAKSEAEGGGPVKGGIGKEGNAKSDTGGYRGAAVYFAVSDDRGTTFRGDFKAADHACECCRIALAVRGDGSVAALWRHIFAPNVRDHALATLRADGTATDVQRVSFEEWKIDACPHHGPAMALDDAGRAHAVWFSGAEGKGRVFYGRTGKGGVDGMRRVGGDLAAHADIAVKGSRVAIAWKEFAEGRTRLRAMISDDGGGAWREADVASVEGASDHPRLLVRGGEFVVSWNSRERPLGVYPVR